MTAISDRAPRYRGIRVMSNCEHCGMPLPLLGPVREVHCEHCQETNRLTPYFWQELLDGVDCKGESFTIPGKFDVDLRMEPPPAALQEAGFATPDWLQPLTPSTRHFFGARQEPGEHQAALPLELDDNSSKPVMMTCPQCSGSLQITPDTPRTCTCQYCSSDIYLPDNLWRRMHPVTKATRWYVQFEGESATDRELRLNAERTRLKELQQLRYDRTRKRFRPGIIAGFAAVLCIPTGGVNCICGLITSGDPLFGLHSAYFCPKVCDECTGPYIPEGDEAGEVDTVYCTTPTGRKEMPPWWIIVFPGAMFMIWFVLLLPVVTIWAIVRDRKARRELPAILHEIASREAVLTRDFILPH